MTTSASNIESTTQTNNSGYSEPGDAPIDSDVPPVEEEKPSNPIEDMYDHSEEDKPKDVEAPKDEEKPKEEEAPVDPATGYEKPKEDIKPADEPKDEEKPKEEDKEVFSKEDVDKTLGELGEGYDTESISKFAIDNKFSKEQLIAYVAFAKDQDTQELSSFKERQSQQRNDWKNELQDDKSFSGENGENFLKSVNQVEKVLEDLMPNTKKTLTDSKKMLPPYIMKDILNVYRTMNPKAKLVGGDPSTPVKSDKGNFLDEMYE